MIGRTIWLLALAALALVAGLAELDRASRRQAALAGMVPAPFRGFAAERLTGQAIMAKDGALAMREARRLVAARPLPAEHMRLLSQAAALSGDAPRALAAMEAATMRGWRDPQAQFSAARSALLQGQYEAAAQRISALFATGALPEQANALLAELLASPQGLEAFAGQLIAPSRWRDGALTAGSQAIPADRFASMLVRAQARGAGLPCDRLGAIAASYQSAGKTAEAALFWPGACPQS